MTARTWILARILLASALTYKYHRQEASSFVTNHFSASHPGSGFRIPALGGDRWFNSKPLTPADLKGKVVLVDFWDYTCVNCLRTLPYVTSWWRRYQDQGLVIIGVHTPEFEFAKKPENVERAVKQLGITYPVVMDNDYRIWSAFGNQYWPREYLFDAQGRLRHDHVGEGDYADTETWIQKLLKETRPGTAEPEPLSGLTREDTPGAVCYPVTAELYAGPERGRLGSPEGYQPGKTVRYTDPGRHQDGVIYARGLWANEPQALRHGASSGGLEDYLLIKYHAVDVNAVIRPEGDKSFRVYVFQDGKPLARENRGADIRHDEQGGSYVLVDEARMYRLVSNAEFGEHELKLASQSPGFALYACTFGGCTLPK